MSELFKSTENIQGSLVEVSESDPVFSYNSFDLMEMLKCDDILEFNEAVNRAIMTCKANSISLHQHFKKIYVGGNEALKTEWHFSSLACYLVIINANPANCLVARAQLYLFKKNN